MTDKQKQKLQKLVYDRIAIKGTINGGAEESIADRDTLHNNMETIENEVIPALNKLIDLCGGDSLSSGQEDTAFRVVKAWFEQTMGYDEDPAKHLKVQFVDDFTKKQTDDMVIVKDITYNSVCEHHIMPFMGKIHIGYIPNKAVVGISKIPRMVKGYAKRMQLQERLGDDIATAMLQELECAGVIVVIEGVHTCMVSRGIQEPTAITITSHTRGIFREKPHLEETFLRAISK